ncbi:MAG: delta(1)-pyrroline-2-carboxylate reductase family protein [Desulfobacterales bacterium]
MNPSTHMIRIFDAAQTRRALPYPALCDALADMLQAHRTGRIVAPERMVVSIAAEGTLLVMPASDGRIAITKLVTVHPQNRQGSRPTIQGEVIVMDAANGRRLGIIDGITVTARRTAAVSALAARRLAPDPAGPLLIVGAGTQARAAPDPAGPLLIVGAGTQARSHLEAFREVLSVQQVFITSRTRENAEKLAVFARSLELRVQVLQHSEPVLKDVTLIVTATNSASPVIGGELRPDAFVAAVGAFTPSMAELAADLVRRSRLFADSLEGVQAEAGDFIQAGIDWERVRPLAEAIEEQRPEEGPVIFKSVGHAMFDLAAARLAFSEGGH